MCIRDSTSSTTPEKRDCPSRLPGNWIGPSAKTSSILLRSIPKQGTGTGRTADRSFELQLQEHNYNCRNFPFQSSTAGYGSRKEEEKEKTSSSSMRPVDSIAALLIFYRRAWRKQRRDGSDRRHAPKVPLSRRKDCLLYTSSGLEYSGRLHRGTQALAGPGQSPPRPLVRTGGSAGGSDVYKRQD